MRSLEGISDASLDGALAKSSLDAILCEKESREKIAAAVASLHRVLKKGAALIVVSHDTGRESLFAPDAWKVVKHDVKSVEEPRTEDPNYHLYACIKL